VAGRSPGFFAAYFVLPSSLPGNGLERQGFPLAVNDQETEKVIVMAWVVRHHRLADPEPLEAMLRAGEPSAANRGEK
jgi:hypothetical protein